MPGTRSLRHEALCVTLVRLDESGTARAKDIAPGQDGSYPFALTNIDGKLIFNANDGAVGYELWQSDGTNAGTVLIADLNPGSEGSYPRNFTQVDTNSFPALCVTSWTLECALPQMARIC